MRYASQPVRGDAYIDRAGITIFGIWPREDYAWSVASAPGGGEDGASDAAAALSADSEPAPVRDRRRRSRSRRASAWLRVGRVKYGLAMMRPHFSPALEYRGVMTPRKP